MAQVGRSLIPAPKGWAQLEQLFPTPPSEFGVNRSSTGSAEIVSALLCLDSLQGPHGTPELTHSRVWLCPRLARSLWELLEGAPAPSPWSRTGVTGPCCHCPEAAGLPPSSSSWSGSSSEGLGSRWGRAPEG